MNALKTSEFAIEARTTSEEFAAECTHTKVRVRNRSTHQSCQAAHASNPHALAPYRSTIAACSSKMHANGCADSSAHERRPRTRKGAYARTRTRARTPDA
eukprot:6188269-Pleurochrysis_carterae.AAC.4